MNQSHTTTGSDQPSTNAIQNSQNYQTERRDLEKEYLEEKIFRDRRDKENRRKREVIEILGGPKPFEDFTFEKFRPHEAFNAFQSAIKFQPEKENLFLCGVNGVGKTHLATAIAHKFIDLNYDVRFFYVPTLIRDFRIRSGKSDFEAEKKWIKKLVDAQVLGMDELGQGTITDYVIDILCEILDGRIRGRRNGIVITSNFQPKDIHFKYGGKVFSRITRLCKPHEIILFPGKGVK